MNEIYNRRSIRKFLNKDLSLSLIESIIDAGRAAPSAKNRQPWKYIVFANNEKIKLLEIMEAGILKEETSPCLPNSSFGIADAKNTLKIMKEAPVIIMAYNVNGKSPFDPLNADDRFTEICDTLSIGASIENILLKAEEIGLGTLWIANTCFAYNELTEYIKIKGQLIGAVAVGYANEKPMPRSRKNLKDIIEYRI